MNALALAFAITMYRPHGPVTFCGQHVAEMTMPWVAMPYRDHGVTWECGDLIALWDGDDLRVYPALDSGPFGKHCVMQPSGECLPIVADVPEEWAWFEGLSTVGRVDVQSARQREWEQRQGKSVY